MKQVRLPMLSTFHRGAKILVFAALVTGCAGPRLIFEDVNLRTTGNADRPVEWRATVINADRTTFSLCRTGSARAVITVGAELSWDETEGSPKIPLWAHVIADGGDPSTGFPDALAPGDTKTRSWAMPLTFINSTIAENGYGTTWRDYPYVFFRIQSYEPPVSSSRCDYRVKSGCKRWNTVHKDRVDDLLAKPRQ